MTYEIMLLVELTKPSEMEKNREKLPVGEQKGEV